MDFQYEQSECYQEYRQKMASQMVDGRADQELVMRWVRNTANWLGQQMVAMGKRMQPAGPSRKLQSSPQ